MCFLGFNMIVWNQIIKKSLKKNTKNTQNAKIAKLHCSALQLHFIQCPFPNQIQFGLENYCVKFGGKLIPNQIQFGLEKNPQIIGKLFQTKSSLVWKIITFLQMLTSKDVWNFTSSSISDFSKILTFFTLYLNLLGSKLSSISATSVSIAWLPCEHWTKTYFVCKWRRKKSSSLSLSHLAVLGGCNFLHAVNTNSMQYTLIQFYFHFL